MAFALFGVIKLIERWAVPWVEESTIENAATP
jgi:hypothetical protein